MNDEQRVEYAYRVVGCVIPGRMDRALDVIREVESEARQQAARECAEIVNAQIQWSHEYGGATGVAELARNEIIRRFALNSTPSDLQVPAAAGEHTDTERLNAVLTALGSLDFTGDPLILSIVEACQDHRDGRAAIDAAMDTAKERPNA